MMSDGRVLIQYDWCPGKKKGNRSETHRRPGKDTGRTQAKEESPSEEIQPTDTLILHFWLLEL